MAFAWCYNCKLHITKNGKPLCGELKIIKQATQEELNKTQRNCCKCWQLALEDTKRERTHCG